MTGKQEGPYKGEETKAEEDKLWQLFSLKPKKLKVATFRSKMVFKP